MSDTAVSVARDGRHVIRSSAATTSTMTTARPGRSDLYSEELNGADVRVLSTCPFHGECRHDLAVNDVRIALVDGDPHRQGAIPVLLPEQLP
jgi:hypothetical protein